MTLPPLAQHAGLLRYDRERGSVLLLDLGRYPHESVFHECADVDTLIHTIEATNLQGGSPLGYAAGYGLALVARAWRERPSDARRGALIQAAEMLRQARTLDARLERVVEQSLAQADSAILAGADAEAAIVSLIERELRRADKIAERCGRIAAGLLAEDDRVLTHDFAGAGLGWMLQIAHNEEGKPIHLYVAETDQEGARLTVHLARTIGVPVTLPAAGSPGGDFASGTFSVFIAAAARIALDGSVAGTAGFYQHAVLAKRHGIPCYMLGYDGPDPTLSIGSDILLARRDRDTPDLDLAPPDLISAIITTRGIYRPEMIARYLDDGDAPLDVIPLAGA